MAESTSPKGAPGEFAKKFQKQLSRGKEKVLQKLGKTMETRDDQFELCFQIFTEQQNDGNRVYKDFRNYINAVRDMREASRRLNQSLFDAYDSDWVGEEDLGAIVEGEDLLWNDYEVKLLDQAVRTMESYVSQFPDVREKVAKRGRKLVDYDSSLHHLEALQTAKKRDDIKINKAKEEMKAAKAVYERINNELKEELPVLYDSRVGCYVAVFSALANLRDIFYKEITSLNVDLQNVIKELQAQHPDKTFAVRGLQRYGSLKRRSLMSPKSWKASFSEFHRSYNPRDSLRSSFRSSNRSRQGTLTRESSSSIVAASLVDDTPSESRELDAASSHTEERGESIPPEVVEEKLPEQSEDKGEGGKAPESSSSSELNNSFESESLDMQLSAGDSSMLHIEEDDDHPVCTGTPKTNGLENGGLISDPKDSSIPHKDAPVEKPTPQDSKSTDV